MSPNLSRGATVEAHKLEERKRKKYNNNKVKATIHDLRREAETHLALTTPFSDSSVSVKFVSREGKIINK